MAMSGEREHDQLAQVRQRITELGAAALAVEYECHARRRHVELLQGSLSWRLTAPLRLLARPFTGRSAGKLARRELPFDGLQALQAVALAERPPMAREMLARMATNGQLGFAGLASRLAGNRDIPGVSLRSDATLALARVVADQRCASGDVAFAVTLLREHLRRFGSAQWTVADHVLLVDLLESTGGKVLAARHLQESGLDRRSPLDALCLQANLQRDGDAAAWLATINQLFLRAGIEPVDLGDGEEAALDRLQCRAGAAPDEDEANLVSVVMPVYRPDAAVDQAIASVLAQSWRALELIIADDGSPPEYHARLRVWEQRDARVKLLLSPRNAGTYVVRNLALAQARGRFVTCHDADDWSHPRKIERQVAHLQAHPGQVANFSSWARVSPDLRFERFSMRGSLVYPNLSSLMFRREPVLSALGGWDEVRYGADTEFCKRIEKVFGRRVAIIDDTPLSFGRVHPDSLTNSTLGRGYVSFERRWYESAWSQWHRELAGNAARLDRAVRPFPAPAAMLPERRDDPVTLACDLLLVADYCLDEPVASYFARRIRESLQAGLRVALLPIRTLHTAGVGRRHAHPAVQALINSAGLDVVSPQQAVRCRQAHVLYPRVLEFSGELALAVEADEVTVEAPGSSTASTGTGQVSDLEACLHEAARLFGRAPILAKR